MALFGEAPRMPKFRPGAAAELGWPTSPRSVRGQAGRATLGRGGWIGAICRYLEQCLTRLRLTDTVLGT